jgi:ankyrin repeat protein
VNHVHKITGNTPLIIAASVNQGKAIKVLLENGADASFKNKNGQASPDFAKTDEVRMIFILADKATGPFFKSVLAGDIQEIKRKLGEGFDVNTRDVTGSVALIHSASAGDIEMVKLLLSYNADVNAYDNRGTSALSAAAKTRKGDIVKMLLAEGAEPNSVIGSTAKDKADSPLISAIKANDFSIVKDLIAAGALVNEVSSDLRGLTPLLAACKFGSGEMVDFLIGKDAKLDVVDGIDFSPLITAVSAGRIDIVKLLWQKYKQPLFSGNRWTALGVACDNGKFEMVKFLVENGADVNIVSQEYKISPLMTAYRNPEITEYLIKHGAEIEHEGGILNSTALSLAIRDDQTFLSLKQLENVKLPPGISEIQTKKLAETHSRQLAVVEVLLKAGANQDHKDKSGKSPRDYANNPDIKALLNKYNKK